MKILIEKFFNLNEIREKIKDKNEEELLLKIMSKNSKLLFPFFICKHFDIEVNYSKDGENIWEIVADIEKDIFNQLNNLIEVKEGFMLKTKINNKNKSFNLHYIKKDK